MAKAPEGFRVSTDGISTVFTLTPEQEKRFNEALAKCTDGTVRILNEGLTLIPAIPRNIALPFWKEFLCWQDGLEQMLRSERMSDAEIQNRLDDEYTKACERLAERARLAK